MNWAQNDNMWYANTVLINMSLVQCNCQVISWKVYFSYCHAKMQYLCNRSACCQSLFLIQLWKHFYPCAVHALTYIDVNSIFQIQWTYSCQRLKQYTCVEYAILRSCRNAHSQVLAIADHSIQLKKEGGMDNWSK